MATNRLYKQLVKMVSTRSSSLKKSPTKSAVSSLPSFTITRTLKKQPSRRSQRKAATEATKKMAAMAEDAYDFTLPENMSDN